MKDKPKAVLFELAERGYGSPFEHARRVHHLHPDAGRDDAADVAAAVRARADAGGGGGADGRERIDELIRACTFHEPKARTIHAIARRVVDEFGGELPCDFDALTGFAGVGPKCANLALGIACDRAGGIRVDIHVHRVTNRWGYVLGDHAGEDDGRAGGEAAEAVLGGDQPLLVPFGKHVCTGKLPKCSTCPVLEYCRQVGVTEHR